VPEKKKTCYYNDDDNDDGDDDDDARTAFVVDTEKNLREDCNIPYVVPDFYLPLVVF